MRMRHSIAPAIILTIALTACSPTLVDADRNSGVVANRARVGIGIVDAEFTSFANRSRELSLERADRHCAQFDKRARITVKGDNAIQFECVYDVGEAS